MKKIILLLIIFFTTFSNVQAEEIKRITVGNKNAKITIIAFESLTCSHCANFHKDVYPQLKKDYIDKGLVQIEFRHFPLDITALNASKISQCKNDGDPKILESLYSNQHKWIKGSTIEEANTNLQNFLSNEGINVNFESCITGVNCGDEEVEILNIPQTSDDGTPPKLPPNSIVINYDCFENGKKDPICCYPPIPNKCKNLIDELKKLLEQLLKDIFTEFFKATSSPVIFDFDIIKVVKACVVSWFLDSFTSKLGSPSSPNSQLENAVKFYIRVSVQALVGGQMTNTRDLFIHVNVNSLKILTEVPNLNVLLSKILTTEFSNIINEIHKELKKK